ncbi:MAG: ATP-dependent 6-phosphofructokinase [Pseudomonadota bacterium]|nr:ATP-dependent 6-phosphofructokinase [Pseudomonadota bacterium]
MKRIAICTGGGDCPGLNATIRSVVKSARGTHGWQVFGVIESINGLLSMPPRCRELGLQDVTSILTLGGTIISTSNTGSPFSDAERTQQSIKVLKDNFRNLGLDALIVVGGEGTQSIAALLGEAGVPIIGIPKTIDRDLPGSDETIGFHTAVDVAADAAVRLQTTAESHDRIMILEVMGRHTGYIALHAGLAGAANVILIPEIPFSYDAVIKKIMERKALGRCFSLIVVAEGAYEQGHSPAYQVSVEGRELLGGISSSLSTRLYEATGIQTRVTVLGHTQRGGSPSVYDRNIATAFGCRAVELIKAKRYGRMVVMQQGEIRDIELSSAAEGKFAYVDINNNPYLKSAEAIGTCLGRNLNFSTEDN